MTDFTASNGAVVTLHENGTLGPKLPVAGNDWLRFILAARRKELPDVVEIETPTPDGGYSIHYVPSDSDQELQDNE